MAGLIWLDGRIVDAAAPAISPLDRAVLHGYGLFETMRAYRGRVFRLAGHYARLADGAAVLGLSIPLTLEAAASAIAAALDANGLLDARVRLTLTAGPAGGPPAVFVSAAPIDYAPEDYERGWSAVTSPFVRNERSPLARVKSLNYLENLLARRDARRRGANTAILVNTRGLLVEGDHSNLFVVREGRIATPDLSSGALPGVTRTAVIELARENGLACDEAGLAPGDLASADEAFLTGSVMEGMPLVAFDDRPIGAGSPGPLTTRLMRLYRELVERET